MCCPNGEPVVSLLGSLTFGWCPLRYLILSAEIKSNMLCFSNSSQRVFNTWQELFCFQNQNRKSSAISTSRSDWRAYVFDCAARLDAVVEAHPLLVIRVLPMAENVLVAGVVGMLIQQPAATLYLDGVAAVEVSAQVRSVGGTLVASPLEILILEKHDLCKPKTNEFLPVTLPTLKHTVA